MRPPPYATLVVSSCSNTSSHRRPTKKGTELSLLPSTINHTASQHPSQHPSQHHSNNSPFLGFVPRTSARLTHRHVLLRNHHLHRHTIIYSIMLCTQHHHSTCTHHHISRHRIIRITMLCLGHLSLWSGVVRDTSPAYVHATLHESIHRSHHYTTCKQEESVLPSGVWCAGV